MEGDFKIGPWLVQPQLNALVGPDQQTIQLEPKAMEVLVCLAKHPEEVLSKDRILGVVWPDTFVTEDVLIHAVVELRKAFGDDAREPTYIQTIPKRGYHIIAPVDGLKAPAPGCEIVQKTGRGPTGELFPANDIGLSNKAALNSVHELQTDPAEADTLSTHSDTAITAAPRHPDARWRLLRFLAAGVILLVAGAAAGYLLGVRRYRPLPTFQRLTYRRGIIHIARFAPDGNTIFYGAEWGGQSAATFTVRPDSPEFHPAMISDSVPLSVSRSGELAVLLKPPDGSWSQSTLARIPLSGGTPREMMKQVLWADWGPNGKMAVVRQGQKGGELQYPAGKVLFATTGSIAYPRFSPSGDRIAFVHYPNRQTSAGEVVVVTTSGAKKVLSGNWGAVLGLAWMPKTGEIWFTASRSGSRPELQAVTMAGACRTIHSETAGLILEDISGDGRVLLNSLRIRANTELLAPGVEGARDLSWLEATTVADISPDGKYITFEESGEETEQTPVSYIRSTSGAPPVKLGTGSNPRLSPDGKSVVVVPAGRNAVTILPIGAGEPRRFPLPGFLVNCADWLPGRRRILFTGSERGQPLRAYLLDLDSGKTKPATPAIGPTCPRVSPDGRFFTSMDLDGRVLLFPLAGGDPVTCPGIEAGEYPRAWSEDSKSLYVHVRNVLPVPIYRVEWETGRRTLWKEIPLPDPAGVRHFSNVVITPDGKYCAYSYIQQLSVLYLADRLR